MKQKAILIIALLALVSMMIAPVMAESLTGTIGGDSVNSQSYSLTPNWAYPGYFSSITVNGSEYIPPAFILVRFDDGTIPNYASQGLPRAPSGNTTSVYICYSTEPCTQLNNRGHGTIGYQRNFDNAFPTSNEIDGFQWIDITDFNSTGVTGFNKFNLIFDFDGTLTSCNCIHALAELKRLTESRWRYRLWIVMMAAKLPFYWLLNKTSCLLFNKIFFSEYQGMKLENLTTLCNGPLLKFMQENLFCDAITTISMLREQGWCIVIISASISAVVCVAIQWSRDTISASCAAFVAASCRSSWAKV